MINIHLVQVSNLLYILVYVCMATVLHADLSSESLLTCFKIIDNYCMLGGADFLQVSKQLT